MGLPLTTEEGDECLHGLPPGTCSLCKPKPLPPRPAPTSRSRFGGGPRRRTNEDGEFFAAKYDGWCKAGEHEITAGDLITRSPTGSGYDCEEHA